LDLEVARSLADLVSVDAAVVRHGKILHANTALQRRTWEDRGWKETEGKDIWDIFPEANTDEVREWYGELKGRDDRFGILVLRKRPTDAPVEKETVYAIRFEDRELVVIRSEDARPVMERFREMETMNRMFKSYLRAGGLGMMILQDEDDREGIIRFISPEGASILDRELADLVGESIETLLTAGDHEEAMALYRGTMRGQRIAPDQQVRFQGTSGEDLILDLVVGSTTWHGEPAAYCLFRDETSRHIMLEELRHFAQGFEMLNDTMVLADKNFDIMYVNPTGLERSGYTFEEVLGQPATIFASNQPDELNPLELADELFDKGHWSGERMAIAKDGKVYPVEISVTLSTDPKGVPELIAVLSRDITERKEAERNLQHARDRAEFFTDLMSHDISNYIQGVLGWLDLLTKDDVLDGQQQDHASKAKEQAGRVSELISRVRSLSRAEHPEDLTPVDLGVIIDEAIGDLRHKYKDRSVTVQIADPEGPVMVSADDLLKDLVINVLDNAIKFSGGQEATVDVDLERIDADGRRWVRFSVSDRGPGIPDKAKSRVFYRFVRTEDSTEGTGLGLSLVMALTDRYQGRVWVEDRVPGDHSGGAKVIVELPEG
jgi:PAS domain S-box-containing protein